MAQHDYVISDQNGASFRSDLNLLLAAIVSNNSGTTEPTDTFSYMWWSDTTTGLLKQRNAADDAWITIGTLASPNLGMALLAAAAFTGAISSTAGDLNLKTTTALSDAAATLTAAQLIGGEFTITPTVARIQTTDTAANIISALTGSVNNSNFTFTIVNTAAFDVSLAAGTGVTLVGRTIISNGSATWRVRRLTGSTVSFTRLGGSALSDASTLGGLAKAAFGQLALAANWSATQSYDGLTLTDQASVNWDMGVSPSAILTLGGNRTLNLPTNIKANNWYTLLVRQDGTGSRTLAYNAAFKGDAPTLSTDPNLYDLITFYARTTGELTQGGILLDIGT